MYNTHNTCLFLQNKFKWLSHPKLIANWNKFFLNNFEPKIHENDHRLVWPSHDNDVSPDMVVANDGMCLCCCWIVIRKGWIVVEAMDINWQRRHQQSRCRRHEWTLLLTTWSATLLWCFFTESTNDLTTTSTLESFYHHSRQFSRHHIRYHRCSRGHRRQPYLLVWSRRFNSLLWRILNKSTSMMKHLLHRKL